MNTSLWATDGNDRTQASQSWRWTSWSSGSWCGPSWWDHEFNKDSNGWHREEWNDAAWDPYADKSAWILVPEQDHPERNLAKEEVISECREHMSTAGKRNLLLCTLGVVLSPDAREFLKKTDQGLKSLLSQYPTEFILGGPLGRECCTYVGDRLRDDRPGTAIPEDAQTANTIEPSVKDDASQKEEPAAADLNSDGKKQSGESAPGKLPTPPIGAKIHAESKFWCPHCSRAFVKWSQCRQHILTKGENTCRVAVLGVNGAIDEPSLYLRCLTQPLHQ